MFALAERGSLRLLAGRVRGRSVLVLILLVDCAEAGL